MTPASLTRSSAAILAGSALASLTAWAFLNVPESNVLALTASAALVLLMAVLLALTVSLAALVGEGMTLRAACVGSLRGVPGFVLGGLFAGLLWWLLGRIDSWWMDHTGEIDALFIRYASVTNTGWLHTGVGWFTWLAPRALAVAIVGATTLATLADGVRGVARGLRVALAGRALGVALAAVCAVAVLWSKGAYWRPRAIPVSAELAFAIVKLMVIAVLMAAVASVVVSFLRARLARRD